MTGFYLIVGGIFAMFVGFAVLNEWVRRRALRDRRREYNITEQSEGMGGS
ncbi:MAG: hypothetical protein VYB54_02335 [Pseudomonadota bacterium]|nr:hypothetical protein [Pseudomonadota bacterium]